jgi:hypothetical protein
MSFASRGLGQNKNLNKRVQYNLLLFYCNYLTTLSVTKTMQRRVTECYILAMD